eukprot:COSAG04_NODE_1702_length_5888_cov_2.061323_3_plen_201_part_00
MMCRNATQTQTPEHRPPPAGRAAALHRRTAWRRRRRRRRRRSPRRAARRRCAAAQTPTEPAAWRWRGTQGKAVLLERGAGAGRSWPPNSQRAVARRGAAPGRGVAPGRWAPAQLRATASMAAGRGLSRGADDAAFSSAPAHALSPAAFLGCGSCWVFWLGAGRRPAWLASAPATALSIVPAASLTPALRLISRRSGPRGR